MILDRTTYEAWLLDRIEGNLSPEQERQLVAFLVAHPDLNVDIQGFPAIEADPSEPIDWKHELKKRLPPTGVPDVGRLDEFLVARLEGDLGADESLALDQFLYEHPEFGQVAERIRLRKVHADNTGFADKASIERHFPPVGMPDKHRLTDFLIAAHEGDLRSDQRTGLERFMNEHPELGREAHLVLLARATREQVVFPDKLGLKKKEARVIVLWQRYAVAASIALLLGFVWWLGKEDGPAHMAKQERPAKVQAPTIRPDNKTPASTPVVDWSPEQPAGQATTAQGGVEVSPSGTEDPTKEPVPAHTSVPKERSSPTPAPVVPMAPVPLDEETAPEPLLAQEELPEPLQSPPLSVDQAPVAAIGSGGAGQSGTPVSTALANAVRATVIDTGERDAALDRDDALAMVNKGLGAITGGKGGVEVDRQGERGRWKLSLGRGFAISASAAR